jgi:hypothetical protein
LPVAKKNEYNDAPRGLKLTRKMEAAFTHRKASGIKSEEPAGFSNNESKYTELVYRGGKLAVCTHKMIEKRWM